MLRTYTVLLTLQDPPAPEIAHRIERAFETLTPTATVLPGDLVTSRAPGKSRTLTMSAKRLHASLRDSQP